MIYRKIFLSILICSCFALPSFAEKIPVKIEPIQIISTNYDEIEIGDYINFEITKDIYIYDDLYIRKGTTIKGLVDFVHPNGWGGDSANIVFKTFYTTDINGKKVTISYPLEIDGKTEMANTTRSVGNNVIVNFATNFIHPVCVYLGFIVRGAEISVEPDTTIYNIFIEK